MSSGEAGVAQAGRRRGSGAACGGARGALGVDKRGRGIKERGRTAVGSKQKQQEQEKRETQEKQQRTRTVEKNWRKKSGKKTADQSMEEIDSVLVDNVKSFAAGGFGGVCAVLTGHPFDLTKVLLQTNEYPSAAKAVRGIVAHDGPLGLYKGVTSPLLGVTPMFAVSFWGYDLGKRLVMGSRGKSPDVPFTIAEISAAGFFSAIPTTLIAAPFERIKVVMQIDKTQATFLQTVRTLYKQGGLRSIYKGSAATLARDGPGSAAYFATYEYVKKHLSGGSDELSLGAITVAGGCAGVAMWTAIFPVDTIKSIQQSSTVKTTMSEVARSIYRSKGVAGFFPGIGPALARSFPANAATFLGVELAKHVMS